MGLIALFGNTFNYKDHLKKDGYVFNWDFKVWIKHDVDFETSNVVVNLIEHKYPKSEPWYVESEHNLGEISDIKKEEKSQTAPIEMNPIESKYTGKVLEVSKWYAQVFKNNNHANYVFRNMRVINTYRETANAILVDVVFYGGVASTCGVCGRVLDNQISIATGIGPICAEKLGLNRPTLDNAKLIVEDLKKLSDKQGVFNKVWIPKSQIKRVGEYESEVSAEGIGVQA